MTHTVVMDQWSVGSDHHVETPIFTFEGGATLEPERCVLLVQQLGCQPGDWVVASDTETGAMPSVAAVTGIVQGLKAAGFRVMVYGNASTLGSGYLAEVDAPWVAEYPGFAPLPAPPLAQMPNVGEWELCAWQYTDQGQDAGVAYDISVHNLPWGAAPSPAPDPPAPPKSGLAMEYANMNLFGSDDKVAANSHGLALDCFVGSYQDSPTGKVTTWLWLVATNQDNGDTDAPKVTLMLQDDSNPAKELFLQQEIQLPNDGTLVWDCSKLVQEGAFSIVVVNNGPGTVRCEAHKQAS